MEVPIGDTNSDMAVDGVLCNDGSYTTLLVVYRNVISEFHRPFDSERLLEMRVSHPQEQADYCQVGEPCDSEMGGRTEQRLMTAKCFDGVWNVCRCTETAAPEKSAAYIQASRKYQVPSPLLPPIEPRVARNMEV